MAYQCANANAGGGQCNSSHDAVLAWVLQGVAVIAFKGDGAGYRSDVAVRVSDRHGLKIEFGAAAFALELVNFALNKCAGRDDDFSAGDDWRSGLGVDVISAVDVAALDGMHEHESDARAGRYGDCDAGGICGGNRGVRWLGRWCLRERVSRNEYRDCERDDFVEFCFGQG